MSNLNYDDIFKAVITITEEYNKLIHFAGVCSTKSDSIKFVARYNNSVYESELSESRQTGWDFNGVSDSFIFDLYIPFENEGDIDFFVQEDNKNLVPAIISYAFTSRINDLPHSFFIGDHTLLTRTGNSGSLHVETLEYEKLCSILNSYINENFNGKFQEDKDVVKEYLAQYQVMSKKKIWLISDRPDRADDNGEYFFKYSAKINDGIEKYFIVAENSPDVKRLEQVGNIVYHGSARHKLLCLFAEKFISAHLHGRLRDVCYEKWTIHGNEQYSLYSGLDKTKTIFLQHGIILHDMAYGLKKSYQNLKLFFTTSRHEYNSILESGYGYDESIVKLTGMPRYDSLYDNKRKKIFFAPTWRYSIPSDELQNSDYCKAINRLLCDKRFIDETKKQGYEILFKPHPKFAEFAHYFKADEYVQILDYNVSYNKLFAESSLLITDYSSTAFDFAYLKKPVVYYHFFPNHIGQSYFDFETMGFGEVITEHDGLVDTVIKYMENNCAMDEKYKQRAEDFFAYTDKNNNKRVYNEIIRI